MLVFHLYYKIILNIYYVSFLLGLSIYSIVYLRTRNFFLHGLTLAITFLPEVVGLSYCTCVFLVTRPFTWYHNFWPRDLDLELWPTFEKLQPWLLLMMVATRRASLSSDFSYLFDSSSSSLNNHLSQVNKQSESVMPTNRMSTPPNSGASSALSTQESPRQSMFQNSPYTTPTKQESSLSQTQV